MPKLAKAYLDDGRTNISVPSTPNTRLNFHGTMAEIINEADLQTALRMEGVIVVPDPEWASAFRRVVNGIPERYRKAVVQAPYGYTITEDFSVVAGEPVVSPAEEAPRRRGKKWETVALDQMKPVTV